MEGGILYDVHCSKPANVQTPFGLSCASRPIHAKTEGLFAAFFNITWVEGHNTFFDSSLIHFQIKVLKIKLVFKVDSEILFIVV